MNVKNEALNLSKEIKSSLLKDTTTTTMSNNLPTFSANNANSVPSNEVNHLTELVSSPTLSTSAAPTILIHEHLTEAIDSISIAETKKSPSSNNNIQLTNSNSSSSSMISPSPSPTNLTPSSLNVQTNLTSLSETSTSSNSTFDSMNNTSNNNKTNTNSSTSTPTETASMISNIKNQGSNYYNDHLVGNGHFFLKKTFHKLTYCHHCTEMLWGIIGQGLICEVCNFVSHEKCQKSVASHCTSIAHTMIKNPVPHCWSEPCHLKKKFCNICRKRLDEHIGVRCQICEYYVHIDCQALAVNDCCETALYVPNRSLKDVTHKHHWREGNLPTNSKCIVCKKSCWTTECLAGMKCEWCGITTHSICRNRLVDECDFGSLRHIIVPPYAVSVPRIDMNKEAILGIQSNRPKTVRSNSTDWLVEIKSESNSDQSSVFTSTNPIQQQQTSNQPSTNPAINELNDNNSSSSAAQLALHAISSIQTNSNLTNSQFQNTASSQQQSQISPVTSTARATSIANNSTMPSQHSVNSNQLPQVISQDKNSSNTNFHGGSSKKKEKMKQQLIDEEEDEIIRVYDGNTSLRKRIFRVISVNKNSTYQGILEASLRTFHINDDTQNYYMSMPISMNKHQQGSNALANSGNLEEYQVEEALVDEVNPIKSIKSNCCNFDNMTKAAIILRYKESESENIRIFPGVIKESSTYQTVIINLKTTVNETIEMALEKFGINKKIDKFSLIEVLLNHDLNERLLNSNDCPLQLIRKLRKQSLCNNRMVRFYLQQNEDPHGSSVALFVGNLPSSLSEIQYEKIIMDRLKNNNDIRWSRFDVIYYEYGSMVILYEDSEKAVKAYKMLKDSVYENKQLMVLLLPTIQHQMILPNVSPLLVFVNVKSGGQQGADLITSFRHLLNPHQVFDIQNGGPLPGLYVFRNIEHYRILACGGDGTIGWVLSCLDNVSQDAKCQSPPMAIVPLGTGNDLARVLRWGAGYTGAEEPINLLRDVIEAEEITLDRWTVVFHSDENKELDDMKRQLSISVNVSQANTNEDNTEIYVMNNYFGIGIEASVCLDFHTAREENPNKFNSRLHNKKKYFQCGIRKIMNRGSCKDFHKNVTIEVDGRRVEISPQIEGIIILNILSWASGTNPWGPEKEDQFQKPTHYDGMLEVIGIKGVVHIGQISGGLSSAIRLAQGGRIKIRMNTEVPVHVDGEPWLQSPCAITILKSALKATMLKKSKLKIKRRNTEPNINVLVNNTTNESNSTLDPDAESEPF